MNHLRIAEALKRHKAMKPREFAAMYETVFQRTPQRLLEIGVHEGGSLRAWQELFPSSLILGYDRNPVDVPDCMVIKGDQVDVSHLRRVGEEHGLFDCVIDDGGHRQHQQRISFDALWPFVSDGGWYVIEDLHVGGLPAYNPSEEQTTLDRWVMLARAFVHEAADDIAAIMFCGRSVAIRKAP